MANRRRQQVANLQRYGLSEDDYEAMYELQEGLCGVCGEPEIQRREDGSEQLLSVDHDHRSGRIRGLLCSRCNTGVGLFRDNPALLRAAAEYLETL